jgi:hypothetical protein
LVGAIEGSKIDIGRSIVDVDIVMIGPEDAKQRKLVGKLDRMTEVKR